MLDYKFIETIEELNSYDFKTRKVKDENEIPEEFKETYKTYLLWLKQEETGEPQFNDENGEKIFINL